MDALLEIERRGLFADEALEAAIVRAEHKLRAPQGKMDARDRALAHELAFGVLRHRGNLDWRLGRLIKTRSGRLPLIVTMALRIGAYQILYLDRIPQSAAVNESVRLVKARAGESRDRFGGLTNAVLRALIREPPAPYPDQGSDPGGSFAIRYSLPIWIASRWLARLGPSAAEDLGQAMLSIPPLTLRANSLKISRDDLLAEFAAAGIAARPTEMSPLGVVLEKCGPVIELPQFAAGAIYVEDEAAQLVARALDVQPGERVLDACAAPGGKTTHLAALMGNKGEIIAMDRSERRLGLLEQNCQRLGVTIVTPLHGDLTEGPSRIRSNLLEAPFDRILVDAPCSGLGVLKRHPEAKWHKTERDLMRLQSKQLRLLDEVADLLRPGGCLVYSTCSTEPDENEQVIEQFCSNHNGFKRESLGISSLREAGRSHPASLITSLGDLSTVPFARSMDAFFACRLRKANRS